MFIGKKDSDHNKFVEAMLIMDVIKLWVIKEKEGNHALSLYIFGKSQVLQ